MVYQFQEIFVAVPQEDNEFAEDLKKLVSDTEFRVMKVLEVLESGK